ncbi:MAG TPA: metal ABC transporter substrate-binding protein [Candidatus Binatia bacterium]
MAARALAGLAAVLVSLTSAAHATAQETAPLRVCATTPDLGALVREIGGDDVAVTTFVKPTEDPHFAEARPSFVKQLSEADLLVQIGLDLEIAWLPALLRQARNPRVEPGAAGYLDASTAIGQPLGIPTTPVDRSQGDVHARGNPHYLLDPLRGLAVARAIAAKLSELRPDAAARFERRLATFQDELFRRLVGPALAARYGDDVPKLVRLYEARKLASFLDDQGQRAELGGWLGRMLPLQGTKLVEDHAVWTYFTRFFGLEVVADLEPLPGVPPTTKSLERVIELMRAQDVRIVLASTYYDPRYANLVGSKTGARVLRMATQVGAVPEAPTYLDMIGYNVEQIASAGAETR